jgi:hypothetical protein
MAAKLSVSIRPETETPDVTRIKQTLFARLKYTREIPTEEQVTEIPVTIKIDGSRRAELAIDGTAQIDVDDHAPKAPFAVQIEAAQGTVLWESPQQKSGEGDTRHIFKVPDAVFDAALNRPGAAPSLVRSGRFVRLDDVLPDFSADRLLVAAIRPPRSKASKIRRPKRCGMCSPLRAQAN